MTPGPRARSVSPYFTSLDKGDHSLGRGHRGQGRDAWEASLNEIFWHRQQGLLQVLKAYTLYRPEQGYCQAQGPVAAVLLMHLPPEVSDLDPALRPSIPSDLCPHDSETPQPQPQVLRPQESVFLYFRPCSCDQSLMSTHLTSL